MLGRSAQLGIPRRVVVSYLAICLFLVAWLLASVVIVSRSAQRSYEEGTFLSYLGRAATTTTIAMLGDEPDLQSLVERFAREKSLLYCAIVSPDGNYLAHTVQDRIGSPQQKVEGRLLNWGDVHAIRFSGGVQGAFREYRVPLEAGGQSLGILQMASAETGIFAAMRVAAEHAPVTLITPFFLVAAGAIVLRRMVGPLAGIEDQLRRAAVAPTLADCQFQPLRARSPGAVGWNRVVQRIQEGGDDAGLNQRISEAVHSLRKEKSDDVLNSLTDGLIVTDHEGRIGFSNHAAVALFADEGHADKIQGKTVEELLLLYLDQEESALVARFEDPELRHRTVVCELKREVEGIDQVLRVARSPIRSTDKNPKAGHVWCLRDVSQQRLAEKMRAQFLDTATHELRTPLANIKAYAETLALSDVMDVESQKGFCNTINAEATRLARFIDDLLSISSMEVGSLTLQRQSVDIERMFAEIVGKVKPQMDKKDITLTTIFPEKYPRMKVDKDKLTVALVNLLGNAGKYTPEGGRVAFKVQIKDRTLTVDVEDSGVGISEEEVTRVFEKFFRSSNPQVQSETGTGLGLSMAQEVIRLHGGDLSVQSVLGEGTTFTATLPLDERG
jgi:two-component system phosphate regulon sensor histidine kinase PhoR